jgi:hypothetical protein
MYNNVSTIFCPKSCFHYWRQVDGKKRTQEKQQFYNNLSTIIFWKAVFIIDDKLMGKNVPKTPRWKVPITSVTVLVPCGLTLRHVSGWWRMWYYVKHTLFQFGAWSLIHNKKNVLFKRHCHATEKLEATACARRCRSSWLAGWWTQKE